MRGRVLIVLLLAGLVAGCQESGFDEAKETARPLKVQDTLAPLAGTKLPGQAERPMTLTADALGDALAIGVEPIRAALPEGRLPRYLRSQAAGVEVVAPITPLDLAAVEAADPDLILGDADTQERLYGDLTGIAPTVMTDGGGRAWKLSLRLHGEALGRTNDAEALLVDWDGRAAEFQKASGGAGTRVAVARVGGDRTETAGEESFAGTVLADAGLGAPAPIDSADVVLVSVEPGGEERARRLGGRQIRVDPAVWWSNGGILAARAALADLERSL